MAVAHATTQLLKLTHQVPNPGYKLHKKGSHLSTNTRSPGPLDPNTSPLEPQQNHKEPALFLGPSEIPGCHTAPSPCLDQQHVAPVAASSPALGAVACGIPSLS